MKEKMLREKGGAKVYIIVIVVLVILCAAVGIFAVVNMNKDKDDDEKTSKKNETNTSKSADEDKDDEDKDEDKDRDDEDEDDDDKDGLVKYSGKLDIAKMMGTDDLKDTVWTMSVEGNDDMISKLIIKAELENYLKESYQTAGGSSTGYTYEEFIEAVQDTLDSQMGTMGTQFTSGLGVSEDDITTNVDWITDETLEIEVDLSKVKRSEYDIEDDESLIDYFVESMEDEGVKMTKD